MTDPVYPRGSLVSPVEMAAGHDSSAVVVNTIGDTVLHAPAAGKRLWLLWIFLSSSQNNGAEVLATVKLGSRVIYSCYLGTPGAFGHRETVIADNDDDALVLNLSAGGQNVAVSWTTRER